jgi:hypothetical protein
MDTKSAGASQGPSSGALSAKDQEIFRAFPKRPLTILYTGVGSLRVTLIMVLLFTVLAVALPYALLPDLLYDFRISKHAVPDTEANIEGSCKTKVFINDCEVKITYRPDPAATAEEVASHDFLFLAFSTADTTGVVRSADDPRMITTSMAIEHLGNRVVTLALFELILGALAVASAMMCWKSFRIGRMAKSAMRLRPVIAAVSGIDKHRNVKFSAEIDGKTVKGNQGLRVDDVPLMLAGRQNSALAVLMPGSDHLILLDQALSVVDFSAGERTAILAAVGA